MIFAADAYRAQLQALLPTGPAWPREEDALLTRLLDAWSQEFARLDARAGQLLDEADPRTTYELLEDWERVLGLPDSCAPAVLSVPARQAECWRKLAFQAGQTPAFYVALAAALGFVVEIFEFDPDVDDYDGSLTALITGGRWRYVWRVVVLNAGDFTYWRAGDRAGELLRDGDSALDLECILGVAKPAHTHVIFTYPETTGGGGEPLVPPEAGYLSGVTVGFETPEDIDVGPLITGGAHTSIAAADGAHGTTAEAGDIVTYTPADGYFGADSFTYTATGPGGTSSSATVSLTVASVPPPTVADLAGVDVVYQTATPIDLSGSITGAHGSIAAGNGAHGTTTEAGDVVTYTPAAGYAGADSFAYTATGPGGTSAPATVSLDVSAVGPPVADDFDVVARRYRPRAIELAPHISGVWTSIAITMGPAEGDVSLSGSTATYISTSEFTDDVSFVYAATGPGGTDEGTVSIAVID